MENHIETHSPVALSWEQTVHFRVSTVRNVLQYGVNLLLTLIIC